MRLAIVIHLEPVLDIAEEAIRLIELFGLVGGQVLVLSELFQTGKSLRTLKERLATRVEQLETLDDKFDLPNTARAEFNITFQFAGFNDLVFDAFFHGRDLVEDAMVD